MWLKRILAYPTGLAIANLSINFERFDDSWVYNDSADELLDAGLYQLVDDGMGNPIYDIIPTRGITHRDSVGPPTVQPTRAGLIDIDDLGRGYFAAGQVHRTITPPTGATEVVPSSELGTQHVDNVSSYADLADRGGLGGWYAQTDVLNFTQIQGLGPPLDIDLVGTFHDVYLWIVNNVTGGNTPANQFFVDDTTMLGLFSRERDALQELQFVLSGEAFPAVTTHQYLYVNANHSGAGSNIRRVTVYNPGQFLRDDDFHWNAQADKTFVNAAIAGHAAQENVHHTPPTPGGPAFSIPGLPAQDTPVAADDLFAVWDATDGATEKVTAGVIRTFMQDGLAGGLTLSDDDPADVGDAPVPGDGATASRDNHGHELPIDSSLFWNADGKVEVSAHDVIEQFAETVKYFTDAETLNTGAFASKGRVVPTGNYEFHVTAIEADYNPSNVTYKLRILQS